MRTTLDLMNAVLELGFEKEYVLESVDKALDDALGFDNRELIVVEFIDDELYDTILLSFKCEKEAI